MMLCWIEVYQRKFADFNFTVSVHQDNESTPAWVRFLVVDLFRERTVLEAVLPELLSAEYMKDDDKDWASFNWEPLPKGFKNVIELMEVVWLFVPALLYGRTSRETIGYYTVFHRRFADLMIQRYYAVAKYEHDYDYGIPCETYDSELFDPTLWPKPYAPSAFQDSKNLLMYSGGKESSMCELVLSALDIKWDRFKILSLSREGFHTDWLTKRPGFECYLSEIRHLWPNYYFETLHLPYEQAKHDKSRAFETGLPLTWYSTITQRLLATFYAQARGHSVIFVGDEFESHQVYRVPKGIFLAHDFQQTQFFHNYLDRIENLNVQFVTPISNFTQGSIVRTLLNERVSFNSCYHGQGGDMWCGKCGKCHRIAEILGQIGYYEHNNRLDLGNRFRGLDLKKLYAPNRKLQNYIGGYTPKESVPLLPQIPVLCRYGNGDWKKYITTAYSGGMHDVWDKPTIQELCKRFNLTLSDRWRGSYDPVYDLRV